MLTRMSVNAADVNPFAAKVMLSGAPGAGQVELVPSGIAPTLFAVKVAALQAAMASTLIIVANARHRALYVAMNMYLSPE
jgi:hypothetical protein